MEISSSCCWFILWVVVGTTELITIAAGQHDTDMEKVCCTTLQGALTLTWTKADRVLLRLRARKRLDMVEDAVQAISTMSAQAPRWSTHEPFSRGWRGDKITWRSHGRVRARASANTQNMAHARAQAPEGA